MTTKESAYTAETDKTTSATEDPTSSELVSVINEPPSTTNPVTKQTNDAPGLESDTHPTNTFSSPSDAPSQQLSPADAPASLNKDTGSIEPSVGADPALGQKPIQKEQGADRPLEEPAGEHADAVTKEKIKTEDTQAGEPPSGAPPSTGVSDPTDQSGKPLGTVNLGAEKENSGIQSESKGSGTGEQYVKSTGLAADGGDFDATKPGAGREADRKFLFPLSVFSLSCLFCLRCSLFLVQSLSGFFFCSLVMLLPKICCFILSVPHFTTRKMIISNKNTIYKLHET